MRTEGDFSEVYEAARGFYLGDDGSPHDPVIRKVGEKWMLESGLNAEPEAEFEISLEAFDAYFYEDYKDGEYVPSDEEIEDFISQSS